MAPAISVGCVRRDAACSAQTERTTRVVEALATEGFRSETTAQLEEVLAAAPGNRAALYWLERCREAGCEGALLERGTPYRRRVAGPLMDRVY